MKKESTLTQKIPAQLARPALALGAARLRFDALARELSALNLDDETQANLNMFFTQAREEIDIGLAAAIGEITKDFSAEQRAEAAALMAAGRVQFAGLLEPGPGPGDTIQ